MKSSPNDMDMIISQGIRISSQGEYPLSGQQKCHVAQDQQMQELMTMFQG